ncbi:radical SAM/SPASM protein FxsB, inactivated metallohydrolase extension form [Streptomyces sp. A3M-1-3]|uniref:radical SAM/SPASM protein FxsBH, inactivated beta-hydroxylase extension form n=1 Tax=Streptomyces sp. A3M-1-3 TaxID=2962044 RepID=UPI0020B83F56|nr:radical SAM/SPASM protein FxsB, inactivated metallohydrolase extension form [Streptomyces sp. A3M-1-3]MCP3821985.1 radical SAM/SPASM protein FxsB, inactivated metallohydrolase extension form [Streptomyces sp. A3M-1-3]
MTGLIAFREIVLKVHSRCDLACDHCYVYEHADQSWRARPKVISEEAVSRTASRLAEHAEAHTLPSVTVILHGGEPLLAGPARLRLICEEFTRALAGVAGLDLRIHTNGLQLSSRILDLFVEYGVKVGISLDGDKAANDRHRRFADGRSSHPLVLRAVDLLREERYRHLYLGLLCTVDVANDPLAVHDSLTALAPPRIDYLLPHATWQTPPARPDGEGTPYADWLLRIFDRWDQQGRPIPVRLFASVLSTLAGGPSLTESLGLAPTDLVVVETDGTLEQVDSLKSAYDGAAATGFDVFSHSFDQVAAHPGVRARQLGLAGVSKECRECPVVRSCGGGLYTHRYKPESGFDNTSVYCADLQALIEGIEARTARTATAAELSDPAELAASQQELNSTLLALLHSDLDGGSGGNGGNGGGEDWDRAWALLGEIERTSDALDPVLDHPYTRSWLLGALDAVREGRSCEADSAGQLAAVAAAAVVAGELELPVPVPYVDGRLSLPTLGRLRLAAPGEQGWAEVRATGAGGFLVRSGRQEWRAGGPGETAADWQPVRRLAADGVPELALDDVDPYRDCFSVPLRRRLGAREAADWQAKLTRAWALLAAAVPDLARAAAAGLTTLTPLDKEEPDGAGSVGRHGPGALGIAVTYSADATALALLTGWRRAQLLALTEVADLYALDGEWLHEVPWRERPVPVSRLLADVYERVAVAAYRAGERRSLDDTRRAMEQLGRAAELTSSGKSLLAGLWIELAETVHG